MEATDARPRAKRGRISRSGDFDAVYRRGRSAAGRQLVLYRFGREDGGGDAPRLGVSISRKVGGAVDRNRLKRVLKEQFAGIADRLPRGSDYVVIARSGAVEYLDEHGSAAVGERLAELAGRLGDDTAARP